jgi:hypothetical protein
MPGGSYIADDAHHFFDSRLVFPYWVSQVASLILGSLSKAGILNVSYGAKAAGPILRSGAPNSRMLPKVM